MDLISKKTRREFQEYYVGVILRQIQIYFDDNEVEHKEIPEEKLPTGQRRGLVEEYYSTVDWKNPSDIKKILKVYQDTLNDIDEQLGGNWATDSPAEKGKNRLIKYLNRDGYEYVDGTIRPSSQSIILDTFDSTTGSYDENHFAEYIDRIKNSIEKDPALAIGSSKELVEATLKTILKKEGIVFDKNDDMPKLLKKVQKQLELVPKEVDSAKKGADAIKVVLSNLGSIVIKTAELRNLYGTGHGAGQSKNGLWSRHAKLVVGASVTLCTFLLDTLKERENK
jgi:hypothetical protein